MPYHTHQLFHLANRMLACQPISDLALKSDALSEKLLAHIEPHAHLASEEAMLNALLAHTPAGSRPDAVGFLPKSRLLGEAEKVDVQARLERVLETGEFTTGRETEQLEAQLSAYMDNIRVAACNSGTTALTAALLALGLGPGDEVIIPANSFAATENAVMATGAAPVLADVDNCFNLDPYSLHNALSPATRAVLPVHLYGAMANMPAIRAFADAHRLFVVEDACQVFGMQDIGRHSHAAAMSFNPYKNLGFCGKAGAVFSHDAALIHRVRELLYHGFEPGKKNIKSIAWGLNSQIDNFQAAVGLAKFPYFALNSFKRILLARRYCKGLAALQDEQSFITLPAFSENHTWHLFPIRFHSRQQRDLARERLARDHGVETDLYYPVLAHRQPPMGGRCRIATGGIPMTEHLHETTLHLPLFPNLTIEEQDLVITALYRVSGSAHRSRESRTTCAA